jgi:signal transduction histidine kinase/CheY-like chemotaxis protein
MFKSSRDLETIKKYNITNETTTVDGEISYLVEQLAIANRELVLQNKEKNRRAGELIVAKQDKVNRADELVIAKQDKVNRAAELALANIELAFQNKEKDKLTDELALANIELAFQNKEKDKRTAELALAKKELVLQNKEKNRRASDLVIAKQDKVNRANELALANKELALQNKEKNKRADELVIAKQDKVNRAAELALANKELAFQNKEKNKRADELVIAKQDKVNRSAELALVKKQLALQNKEKNKRAGDLVIAKQDKVKRADELALANKELALQNKEKNKRADELVIAKQDKVNRSAELALVKKQLVLQNKEKNRRAGDLVIAKQDKVNRAAELALANKELVLQNKEKNRRAGDLVIAKQDKVNRANELALANKELVFQNEEKNKRADELVIADREKVILLQKLQLSQKMEAIGKLTGPISHEYNNMLGIITGYSELIKLNSVNAELINYANEIQYASKRAAKLTSKLLTLSQEKLPNDDIININTLLEQQHSMLEETLTKNINLTYKLQDNIWELKIDQSDMEDAIFNLCINAKHAMNEHGKLIIETENKCITLEDINVLNIVPGEYVLLSFTDNGCGFNEKIKDKIFDPFFTTKGELGTGLGLSIVYNFVKNNGGDVSVHSVVAKGSKFTFYFPRYYDGHLNQKTKQSTKKITKQSIKKSIKPQMTYKNVQETGNVLLVDDESTLLEATRKILLSNGFNVFCAEDATQALKILEYEYIDILISDVIMKNIDGYELATIVKEKYPDIIIQIISGFAGNSSNNSLDMSLYKNMLQKPVDSDVLIKRMRKLFNNR